MRNYLLRLGWSHGDDEIISTEQAIAWFDLDAVGRGAARFDMARLTSLNAHYLRQKDDAELVALIAPRLEAQGLRIDEAARARLLAGMAGLKPRRAPSSNSRSVLSSMSTRDRSRWMRTRRSCWTGPRARAGGADRALRAERSWDEAGLEASVRAQAEAGGVRLGQLAQPLRAALTGATASPGSSR